MRTPCYYGHADTKYRQQLNSRHWGRFTFTDLQTLFRSRQHNFIVPFLVITETPGRIFKPKVRNVKEYNFIRSWSSWFSWMNLKLPLAPEIEIEIVVNKNTSYCHNTKKLFLNPRYQTVPPNTGSRSLRPAVPSSRAAFVITTAIWLY